MAVIDGKYLSIEGLSHLWAELKQKFATAAQGTKADTAVQTIKIGNTEQTKTNGVVTLDTYSKSETNSYVGTAINDLYAPTVGGSTRYIYQISQTDGIIYANSYSPDTTPTASSTKLVQSGGVKTYVDTECGAIANLGAKNMCPYNTFSCTTAGTTVIPDKPINLPAGTYIMSYTQTATTGSSSIRFLNSGTSIVNFTINNDSDLEKTREFTLSSNANQIRVYSSVLNDYTNVMIRPKAISDDTYVPYAPTNRELNIQSSAIANLGAKNISKAAFTSATSYGVTFTANSDGTVTANSVGTQSQNSTLQSSIFTLKAGTYTFSCSPNPQRDATYDSYVYDVDNSITVARDNPGDSPGSTFTLSADTNVRINLRITKTYTANNLIFSPMIRYSVITDETYQPPTLTNTELNDSKITMLNILGAGQRITATASAPLNFNDAPFTSVGRFNWLSTATPYITNCPTYINGENKGGVLETSLIQGPSTVLQTARPSAGADSPTIFWQRFRYGAGTTDNPYRWTSWYAFTGTEVVPANAQTTNLTSGMRSVAQSTEENDFDQIEEPIEEQR